ncbi:DUF2244 domain-containing protein [Pseudohaliea rubra]|uniref:DUF2244 domain-containing protein n=1 Tax=Pseudohaliea rubra DSM 19751 TaxID=1265313 RepID=A0A095VWB1_9GAMM|nr:DUF2244 domain-containing protein [Pseudohaliea rubra]KGE05353.1 hypothetical protein HRUBRA_00033 [Pseudohaliea rubra DSM 19751]
MVTSERSTTGLRIIARPNHSSSWQANQLVLLALAVPSLGVGVILAFYGAWLVLPFAGLELSALGWALYRVNHKLQFRQVITLNDLDVQIDEGRSAPVRSWRLARQGTALAVTPEQHPWEGPRLAVYSSDHRVPVGDFLNRDDVLSLLGLLRAEIRVGTSSPMAQRRL